MQISESILPKIAIATLIYYCLSFAFEIGYFWQIGVIYMSAFSLTEHTVHAASSALSILGVIAFLYLISMYPAIGMDTSKEQVSWQPPAADEPIHWTRYVSFCVILVMFIGTYAIYEAPDKLRNGYTPSSLFGLLFMLSMIAYLSMLTFRTSRLFWIYPAFLTAMISPVALGESAYLTAIKSTKMQYAVDGSSQSATAIFFGSERVMLTSNGRVSILSYDAARSDYRR